MSTNLVKIGKALLKHSNLNAQFKKDAEEYQAKGKKLEESFKGQLETLNAEIDGLIKAENDRVSKLDYVETLVEGKE